MAGPAKIAELTRRNIDRFVIDCGLSESDEGAKQISDRFVSNEKSADIPPPTRKTVDITKLDSILKPQEKAVGADTSESKAVTQEVAARNSKPDHAAQPEMDFPARVINIKIENDQLRARLDKLE